LCEIIKVQILNKIEIVIAVNEDALPGTVVKSLETSDLDAERAPVQFYITGGDPRSEFSIRSTGEVFVSKALDRESVAKYILDIVATDGEHIARTKLTIDILDANGKILFKFAELVVT
jgi:protocadherin Fat 1/2/3